MKKPHSILIKHLILAASLSSLVACSSMRHHGSGDDIGAPGAVGGEGGAGTEGLGSGSGFQPSTNCNVPQVSGKNTDPFYFAYDKSDVHPDDMSRLQTLAGGLANQGAIRVVGNTDNRGSREYNVALGYRRANAVASGLEQAGVSKQSINVSSNGAEKPIAFGSSEDDFQCNRRVDVVYK